MDSETKGSVYHSAIYQGSGSAIMSFKPINAVHQHLCAFHVYSQDRSRHVEAHYYCTHLSPNFHQCVIYDSDEPNAKLIGIECIVSEKIESGLLQMQLTAVVPDVVSDAAEQPAMLELQKTYGKTIHTWAIDVTPELPLGPPQLMMSYTADGQMNEDIVRARDGRLGGSTEEKRELRKSYLPPYDLLPGADEWERTGMGLIFESKEAKLNHQ